MINIGGYIKDSNNSIRSCNMIYNDSQNNSTEEDYDGSYSTIIYDSTGNIKYVWENVNQFTDKYYDIWVLYTKTTN